MKKTSFLFAALVAGMFGLSAQAVEKELIPYSSAMTATASTQYSDARGALKAINGAGLNADGQHTTNADDSWLAKNSGFPSGGIWYRVDLGAFYNLCSIKVWNYNYKADRGAKETDIYYSTAENPEGSTSPSSDWTLLRTVEIEKATGAATYAGMDPINFDPVKARYVLFHIKSVQSSYGGLSEMQFFCAPSPFGECSLTKVADGEFKLVGSMNDCDASDVKLVFSADGQEDVEVNLGPQTAGVAFEKTVSVSDGFLTTCFYGAKLVASGSASVGESEFPGTYFFGATPKVTDFKKKIDFVLSDEAQTTLGESAVDGVPVAIRVSTAIQGFDYADMNVNGTDVVFGAVEGSEITRYSYELEKWNPNGESVFWVKVPSLSAATTITMCYGNNVSVPDNNPTDVWSDYVGVWHMAENGGDNAIDATGHGLNGVPTGSKLTEMASDANAPVGLGRVNQTSAGKYNRLSVPNYNEFITDHSRFTVSGWFKSTNATGYPRPLSRKTAYDQSSGWEIQYNNGSKTQCDMRGSSGTQVTMDGPDVTADWVYLTYVFNGATGTAYANGEQKKSGSIAAVVTRTDSMAIGNNANGTEQGWCGSYDEVRMYNGAQDASRVRADYLAMTPGFLTNGGAKTLDPEAPELGACTLTKVRDGEYKVDGVMAKNGATVKLVFSAVGGEVVEKALGEQVEGVPFTTTITKADGLSDAYPYDVMIIASNDHGKVEKALGSIGLWFSTSVNDFAKKFTVTLPDAFAGELENFPVLVRLSPETVDGFAYADICQNGADFVVVDGEGKMLPCQFETYDTTGESLLWVKFPVATAGASLSVYYGNRKPMVETPDPAAVWSEYAGVWHLNETAAGATTIVDAAGVQDGTSHTSSAATDGVFGGARGLDLDAKNGGMVVVPQTAKLNQLVPSFTVSGWVRPHTLSLNWGYLFSRKTADNYASWGLQFRGSNGNSDSVGLYSNGTADNDSNRAVVSTKGKWTANVWQKYDVVYTDTTVSLYINGVLVDSAKALKPGAAVNGDYDFAIGGFPTKTNHGTIKADQDEVRLRLGAVSADWIADEYAMQSGALAATIGATEAVDSSAPVFLTPISTVNAQGEVTVTITVVEGSGSVYVDVDGEKTKIGDIDPEGTYPQEFVAHPTVAAGEDALISAYGINANGTEVYKKSDCGTMNAAVVVTNTQEAKEDGRVPGIFTVSRPDTATAQDLIVNLAWSGTAEPGIDYEDNLPAEVTIPAGETAATVEVTPIINMEKAVDTTVVCTVTEGPYISGGTATLAVKDVKLDDNFNTWIGGGTDDKASTAANWSLGVPVDGQSILFDGRFANPNNKNCDWDIETDTVASWTQNNGYDGTITLRTVYPGKSGMEVLTVTGAMTIESGTLTHPQSRTMSDKQAATWDWIGDLKANETYRIRIACGSFSLGSAARIDVATKGYYASNDGARCNASHGGTTQKDAAAYGNPKEPIHIGMAHRTAGNYWNGKGGGAIYITVTGAAVVDGVISADSGNTGFGAGAAGSVYLKANSVTGAGSITAMGSATGEGNYKGAGGRIAIITETPVNRATFAKISAETEWKNAQNGQATHFGGCGTVFFKDKDHANGILVVAGKSDWPALSNDKIYRVTPVGTEGDWTFDAVEFGRGGRLVIPVGTALHLPNGFTSITGTSDDPQYAGIRYEGGTLDLGNATVQTMSGGWMFTPWTNYVFNGSLTVQGGAALGVPGWGNPTDGSATLPTFVSCNLEVTGDLTIASDGSAVARNCGFRKSRNDEEKGVFGCQAHGGRTLHYGKTLKLHYQGYDSVFAPFLPGCGAPEPNGQGSEPSGGVIRLTVGGALTVDGKIDANGNPDANGQGGNDGGGVGGAIDITAGSLAGSGKISAEGGSMAWQRGAGGRVAVKLTDKGADFAAFTGYISASGRCAGTTGASAGDTSSGTVYLQTGAEGENAGTIVIKHRVASQYYTSNATNTTEIVSLGYGGDAVEDYKRAKVEVRDYGFAAVNADVRLSQINLATADSKLDLEGHVLTVTRFFYFDGEKPVKLKPGTYTLDMFEELGIGRITDTVGGGSVVVKGDGLTIIVK